MPRRFLKSDYYDKEREMGRFLREDFVENVKMFMKTALDTIPVEEQRGGKDINNLLVKYMFKKASPETIPLYNFLSDCGVVANKRPTFIDAIAALCDKNACLHHRTRIKLNGWASVHQMVNWYEFYAGPITVGDFLWCSTRHEWESALNSSGKMWMTQFLAFHPRRCKLVCLSFGYHYGEGPGKWTSITASVHRSCSLHGPRENFKYIDYRVDGPNLIELDRRLREKNEWMWCQSAEACTVTKFIADKGPHITHAQ